MKNKEIINILNKNLDLKKLYVTGDSNHLKIIAIGDIFKKLSSVQRQQMVYKPLIEMIAEKKIHAISITSYTSKEWSKNK